MVAPPSIPLQKSRDLVGLNEAQVEVDSVVYNTVLAACVSAEQLDQAAWSGERI